MCVGVFLLLLVVWLLFFRGAVLVGAILNLTFYIWSVDAYTEKWHIQYGTADQKNKGGEDERTHTT